MSQVQLVAKNKTVSIVYLDGESLAPVRKHDLSFLGIPEEGELSDTKLQLLLSEYVLPGGRKKAMDLLLAGDRTEKELCVRLAQDGYHASVIESVLTYVRQFHYLDDVRYALNYMQSKGSKSSMLEIRRKLSEKGVSEEDYEEALEKYRALRSESIERLGEDDADADSMNGDAELSDEAMELETLLKLMHKKVPEGVALTKEQKQKYYGYFLRKGFGYHTIRTVLKEYPTEDASEEAFD